MYGVAGTGDSASDSGADPQCHYFWTQAKSALKNIDWIRICIESMRIHSPVSKVRIGCKRDSYLTEIAIVTNCKDGNRTDTQIDDVLTHVRRQIGDLPTKTKL